jgi:hypothetical protein
VAFWQTITSAIRRPIVGGLVLLIRIYQRAIRPLVGPACRFAPTCSEYAVAALRQHGVRRGLALAIRRILRCNPWGGHGYDPVPPRRKKE